MQLEIKIVIDFGEDVDPPNPEVIEGDIKSYITDNAVREFGAKSSTVSMGWTSSGDDE